MNGTPDFIVKPDFKTLRDVVVTAQTEAAEQRDAEVTADALAEVVARLARQRDADYEEFDWREERS